MTLTFNIDADYDVVRTQLTQNVVAIVEGSDPALQGHLRRVRRALRPRRLCRSRDPDNGSRRPARRAASRRGETADRIWNGADDDGSGTVALMAIAQGVRDRPAARAGRCCSSGMPAKSAACWGSRYFADHPTVPLERIVAQLNIDMIGRNRDDKPSEANTVYLVGSDRISSELHEISRAGQRVAADSR